MYNPTRLHNEAKYVTAKKAKEVYGIQKHVPDRFKTTTVIEDKINLLVGFLDGDGHICYINVCAPSASATVEQCEGLHTQLFKDMFEVAQSIPGICATTSLINRVSSHDGV